ncbi:hypothetical protein AURANDRAFT_69138, partial [Aureococcus anophagefferens]
FVTIKRTMIAFSFISTRTMVVRTIALGYIIQYVSVHLAFRISQRRAGRGPPQPAALFSWMMPELKEANQTYFSSADQPRRRRAAAVGRPEPDLGRHVRHAAAVAPNLLTVAADSDVLLELGVQPLTQLTACRLHFLLNQTLAIAPICEAKSNDSSDHRHHPLSRAPQDVSLSVSAAMIAGALHLPNLEYGEAKQSAPSWKLCGNDGYAARPLHAIIDNLSCVAPSCFARDHHTFDSERWQTKATFDILEGLVQHCSTFNFCSGKPLAAPLCVTSLGSITVLRLHDAWDGATSLAWALEHLVELLNEAERTVDPSSPGRIIIVSNVLLAASSRKHSDDAVETMSVHRYCELSAMHKQDDVKSVDRGDARD